MFTEQFAATVFLSFPMTNFQAVIELRLERTPKLPKACTSFFLTFELEKLPEVTAFLSGL